MIRNMMGSLATLAALSSLAAGIEFFEGSWDDAFEAAEANDQLVFVDVYTEWCGPCKLMDANGNANGCTTNRW
ncbi:MAG: thioredoxin family protein [Gammaproteobacteria bacterium]|nr:thioredoxin family protein [Gammaproteobacteria bacterium]